MNWPHGPAHWLFEPGIFMVTAGTYKKTPLLDTPAKLDFVLESLINCSAEYEWFLRAWAIMKNHYHFVAQSPDNPTSLKKFLNKFHMNTAKKLNEWDNQPGRKVWYQYWDSRITFEKSYLARLNYVQQNPVKHSVILEAENYRWCSMAWFTLNAPRSFVATVTSFKIDRLSVYDDF